MILHACIYPNVHFWDKYAKRPPLASTHILASCTTERVPVMAS
jgi:hypothetical protein